MSTDSSTQQLSTRVTLAACRDELPPIAAGKHNKTKIQYIINMSVGLGWPMHFDR